MPQEHEIEQTAADLKSTAGTPVAEFGEKAKQVWDDAGDRVRTFKQDAEEYVRDNPTTAVFTAFGIGLVLGLIIFRR